jgi:hypothetical protein
MPLYGLTDAPKAFMKLGMIRKGEKRKITKQGKNGSYEVEIPVDLDYFRVTFSPGKLANEIEEAFRDAYGDRPQELNVRFADASVGEVWDANYECYKQGGMIAKAGTNESGAYWIFYRDPDTAEVLVRNGSPVNEEGRKFFEKPIDLSTPIYKTSKNEPVYLEPVGRLQVVIPEVAHLAVGYFVFQPGSPRDIRNISAELGMYAAMASSYGNTITGIPFVLGRRKEEITKNINGKLSKGDSWPVHLTAGGIWGRQAIDMIERMAIPSNVVEVDEKDIHPQNAPDWTDTPEEWSGDPEEAFPIPDGVDESPAPEQPKVKLTPRGDDVDTPEVRAELRVQFSKKFNAAIKTVNTKAMPRIDGNSTAAEMREAIAGIDALVAAAS